MMVVARTRHHDRVPDTPDTLVNALDVKLQVMCAAWAYVASAVDSNAHASPAAHAWAPAQTGAAAFEGAPRSEHADASPQRDCFPGKNNAADVAFPGESNAADLSSSVETAAAGASSPLETAAASSSPFPSPASASGGTYVAVRLPPTGRIPPQPDDGRRTGGNSGIPWGTDGVWTEPYDFDRAHITYHTLLIHYSPWILSSYTGDDGEEYDDDDDDDDTHDTHGQVRCAHVACREQPYCFYELFKELSESYPPGGGDTVFRKRVRT